MTALTESGLLRLVEMVYESATDDSRWPVFLKAYAEAVASGIGVTQIHNFKTHRSVILASHGVTLQLSRSYNDHYSRMNIWRDMGQRRYVQGKAMTCDVLCPNSLLMRSEFYNDYLRPLGGAQCTVAVIARNEDTATTLTAMRPEGHDAFSESEVEIASALLPHLTRANVIREKLYVLEASRLLIDGASCAFVFLDEDGKCIYANRCAETIFRENDGLNVRNGRLYASNILIQAALELTIRQTLSAVRSLNSRAAVLVKRISMRRPYQIVVAPASPELAGPAGKPRVIVMIDDPERIDSSVRIDVLAQLYGLTSKEAEVAKKLCEGKTIENIAHELDIGRETARTHLRHIFAKTGVSRQSELVRLLVRIPQRPS